MSLAADMLLVCTLIKDEARLNARESLILLAHTKTAVCFIQSLPSSLFSEGSFDYSADYSLMALLIK